MTARTMHTSKKPHFFKVLLGEFALRLGLPPRFVRQHLRGSSGAAAVVHDAVGGAWDVSLERTADGVFLSGGGWAKFAADHALKESDFVVFRYDGDMHFTAILVFDKTACEKDAASGTNSSEIMTQLAARVSELEELVGLLQYQYDCTVDDLSRIQKDMVSSEPRQGSYRCSVEVEEEGVRASFDLRCSPMISPNKVAAPRRKKSKYVEHSGGDISGQRGIRTKTLKDGAPFPFHSSFPYFVARMGIGDVVMTHTLRLPIGFARLHLPQSRRFMKLRNSDGKVGTVMYIPSPRKSFFSGGWRAFVRDNNLQLGDYCAFELVAPAEFKVTIVRADEVLKKGRAHKKRR